MAIELSNLTFTEQDDIVPAFGVEEIVNTGIANTLAGDDIITGTGSRQSIAFGSGTGISNIGTLNTGDGNDTITGSGAGVRLDPGIDNRSLIDTGDGDDIITGINRSGGNSISNYTNGTIDTGNGNDIITGIGISILGASGIFNMGTINTSHGEDSIIFTGSFTNYGGVFLGDSNDSIISIIPDTNLPNYSGINNYRAIETGDGNDIITSTGVIFNEGIIDTGNGDDSIIVDIYVRNFDIAYGIFNNGGTINTGNGNDSILAHQGFQSGSNNSGMVFLGEGEDYIKSFGHGDFYGGNGNDILELTPGSYTVGIWDTSTIFTKGNQLMITSEFEQLIAGGTIYDFTTLTAGQIIIVA